MLVAALVVAAVVLIRIKLFSGASEAAPVQEHPSGPGNSAAPIDPAQAGEGLLSQDELLGQKLVHSWRDKYYGERTMTFEPGGAGTMVILLDTAGRLLYGEKLVIQLEWFIKDGVLNMKFTSGEPKWAMATILQGWGAQHEQRIELLDETDLHLRSTDSGHLYKLRRVEESSANDAP
jgi:hypothetical protein